MFRFALKALDGSMVRVQTFGHELEGDEPAEFGVFGLIDHTHAAATELLRDAAVGNCLANHARNQPLRTMLGGACSLVDEVGG
jgi:hypothetical protein